MLMRPFPIRCPIVWIESENEPNQAPGERTGNNSLFVMDLNGTLKTGFDTNWCSGNG